MQIYICVLKDLMLTLKIVWLSMTTIEAKPQINKGRRNESTGKIW